MIRPNFSFKRFSRIIGTHIGRILEVSAVHSERATKPVCYLVPQLVARASEELLRSAQHVAIFLLGSRVGLVCWHGMHQNSSSHPMNELVVWQHILGLRWQPADAASHIQLAVLFSYVAPQGIRVMTYAYIRLLIPTLYHPGVHHEI